MKKVYVVVGSTGQYDDYTEWLVVAYADLVKAEEHAKNAKKEADEIFNKCRNEGWFRSRPKNKFDAFMSMDYNGVKYRVEDVEFVG